MLLLIVDLLLMLMLMNAVNNVTHKKILSFLRARIRLFFTPPSISFFSRPHLSLNISPMRDGKTVVVLQLGDGI